MKTTESTPKSTMTTAENGPTDPIELKEPNLLKNEPQRQPSRMNVDSQQPAGAIETQHSPMLHQQDPPGYRPTSAEDEITVLKAVDNESEFLDADDFYENDTSSETELQQAQLEAWVDSPGNATDIVAHSSDDYRDDMDDIGDEDEEDDDEDEDDEDEAEDDEENFSDDTDEQQEAVGKEYAYNRAAHRPYLKSRRGAEQQRENNSRSGATRKRPIRLKTISGTAPHSDVAPSPGASFAPMQDTSLQPTSPRHHFAHICEEVASTLHQGPVQHGVDIVKGFLQYAIEWRETGELSQECQFTAEQLSVLENHYFGAWAKVLLERRPSNHIAATVTCLKDFVKLGYLIIQQDGALPEPYAEVLSAMFEQGDLEIYKRNPKRPSRLAHSERMTRFEGYSSEYGPEDDEVPQLQQDFQRLFASLGGLETCIKALEGHLESTEPLDMKPRNLQLMLGLVSRIPVTGDSEQLLLTNLSDISKRLINVVLGHFPDHPDSFRSVSKATVLDIIAQVGYFLLENYRPQVLHSTGVLEPDADYGEFNLQDPVSRSNLGEVKFADFRLEMAVRLMKTSRLDLRLAGLIELKDVLLRIQRLQQGRTRLRRRSDVEMDVQVDRDRKPIEHLCSRLQSMHIVGCIFGSNIHLEIVQRSTEVLAFLVQAGVLTTDDIDLIWAAVGGNQHPSIVYGVYHVLGELSSRLPHDYLRDLFTKLQAVSLENWDPQLLDLARSLFQAMAQCTKFNIDGGSISLIPYETLLNVLRNSTPPLNIREDPTFGSSPPSNRDVILGIAQLLKDGLGVGPLQQDRTKLIDYCMQDLKGNHPGAIWSLQVVQHIFEGQAMNDETGNLQFYLQTCSSLPELYISNFKAYTSAIKAIPPTPSPTVTSFAPLSTYQQLQEYWRGLQLKMRLDFVRIMAKIFPMHWNSAELAETLWSSLVIDPIGIQEQDEAFACFEAMTEAQFIEYVYEKLLPGLDIATITSKAWSCVRQYFLILNWHWRNLVVMPEPSMDGSQLTVVLAPLYGMDLIWKIALHARNPTVGLNATHLLSSLIKAHSEQQGNSFHETIYEFREGLVATCVDHLVNSSDQLASDDAMVLPDVSLVFERCIGILKAFLAACNAERNDGASRPEIHGALDEDAMLTIKINSNLPLFQLSVHPSGTLGSLRRMVAARFGCSEPDEIRLFSLGKDFVPSWDARTLEELHVDNNQSFLVNKRPHSMTMNRPQHVPKQVSVPTDLLLKPEFFERVRHIFLLDEKYASQAWEVVVRLPTSPVLLHSLEDLQEDVEWTTVLDARTPFLLLYSLQIVNALIKRDQCSEDPDKQTWVKRFLSLGGQQYLTTLLMSESGLGAAKSSPTARKALALMLKVLVRLTYFADIESIMATDSDELTIPAFLNKLVQEILTSAACEGGDSPNDQSIVLNATNLISYLCEGPGGWHYFHTGPDIRSLIYVSMVQSDSMQIRQTVLDMGRKFCQQAGDIRSSDTLPGMFFLEILQSFLPIDKEYENNCSELFEFFEIVARGATEYCSEDYYKALYERLIQTIMNHPSSEDTSFSKEDTVLIGTLKVATAMISTDPRLKQLDTEFMTIDYILDECLFPQTSSGGMIPKTVKCQSDGSRFAAFSFLEESAKGEPDILRHVIMKTRKHFERESELEDQWGYDPQMIKKANCGFVGLQNLGATCYVNSIIQQFFMNKEFRLGILDAPVDRDDPGKHDTLLYQLQALFSNLQGSIKRAYNAHGFCYAYKDWDGNPMNVAVQMDVDEFFNILFDRLENSVKGTPQEYLFKQQYGGKLVQQIKSKDCEHISEREDSFFSIQCEVKNKKTLEESLQLYVQGEILDGDNKYKCSSCDKHVDAIKRACIKELPRNLILHLKRFDYDMDTMRRIKINDRFEFPTRLDMGPYTLDYLTKKEQAQDGNGASPTTYIGGQENSLNSQYNLVGVLVHTGTADSGHYYSYIKDRSMSSGSGSLLRDDRPRWYLFNDSKVEEFDPNDIPIKAFGGSEYIPQDSSPYMKTPPRSTAKPYSAYMLFYERADHKISNPQALVRKDVPADIKDNMVKENTTLLKDLAVFDRLCYRFVWSLFNLYKTCPQVTESDDMEQEDEDDYRPTNALDYLSMQYGLDFFFSILIHARDVDQELQQWTRFLSSLLAQYPKGCATFLRNLSAKQALLYNVLLSCPITQVREAVVELLVEALRGLREQDKIEYGLVSSVASESGRDDSSWMCGHGSLIHRLIRVLLQLLPEARASWRNFDEYFKLIYNITQLGRAERVLMVQEGYIQELVEFYTSDERTDIKRKKMGDKFTKPSFRHLLLAVQEILTVCDIKRSYEALQNQVRAQHAVHGPVGGQAHRKSSGSSSSTSSVLSSPSSDEAVAVGDIHIANAPQELEQAVLLSNADFNALFACYGPPSAADKPITLISKMIQDRIDSAIIASIVIHLSTHDAIGTRLLETLSVYMEYANEDQFTTIMQIFKELVQIVDGQIEGRVEFILVQILKVLEQPPQPSVAYDCLDFFRTISDYGQCGRFAQSWLLRHSKTWLQELLLMQAETDTRVRARLFYMELLSSERAFNGWNDEQAAAASGQHFGRLLELLKNVSAIISYPSHVRRDEEEGGWRFVEYFKALTELVKSEGERNKFVQYWSLFIEILTKLDSQQLNLDYDKKEMMVFWNRLLTIEDVERDVVLAKFKPIGNLLRKFYVCLQHNPANVQFHQEILPIYFGLVLRFSKLEPTFHMEWAQCHNFTWALQAMKWGLFTQHCPEELNQLLQYTLAEIPQYRRECWQMLPSPDNARHLAMFAAIARWTFEAENAMAGALFYQHRGLVHLTDAMMAADRTGTLTNEHEFFAVDTLGLLCDYLCQMNICRNTPSFAEAMDHWSNIDTAIELLAGNLMWTAPPQVYAMSIKILDLIVKEATFSQSVPILAKLTKAQYYLREAFENGKLNDGQLQGMFGGSNSPFCQYGVLESHQNLSGMGSPLMRIGPLIFMHPSLYLSLEAEAAQRVLQEWFMPYWELARSACLLDGGGNEHSEMAIELAALMAMEQLTVGSLMHAEILWDAAVDAANSGDLASLLEHRIVALYMEKLLNRERYLGALTEHLSACGALLKASSLSETIVATALEDSLSQAEKILNPREEPSSSPLDNMPLGEQELSEKHVEDLVTALQNLVILGVDVKGEQEESVRLSQVHEAVRVSLSRIPESYRQILSELVQSNGEEAASDAMAMSAGDGEVAPAATKFVHGPGEDTSAIVSPEEDPTVMTGIIEDSASGEGKAM